jgi:hypothetical protein
MYGPIPARELLSLPRLRYLSLRHNNFSSFSLPTPTSNDNNDNNNTVAAALEVLDMGHNRLAGAWLQESLLSGAEFPRLITLALDGLGLEGPLPPALPHACPALVALDLSQNRLDGEVPAWVAQALPALKLLNLSHNRLCGSLPAAVLASGRWDEVKLFGNDGLTGPVPFKQ